MRIRVIALDFDGVIVESTEIKTEAFAELFRQHPEQVSQIVEYHRKNEGVSRYQKFKHIYEDMIGLPYGDEVERELDKRFSHIVLDKIKKCDFVNGSLRFLQTYYRKYPLYLISATPDEELKEIVEARGLTPYFVSVFGSSRSKPEWLRLILDREKAGSGELLLVGDSSSDYRAAVEVGTLFVGRLRPGGENIFPAEGTSAIINDLKELSLLLN